MKNTNQFNLKLKTSSKDIPKLKIMLNYYFTLKKQQHQTLTFEPTSISEHQKGYFEC